MTQQKSDTNVAVGFNVHALWSLAAVVGSMMMIAVGLFQSDVTIVAIGAGVLGLPAAYTMVRNGRLS